MLTVLACINEKEISGNDIEVSIGIVEEVKDIIIQIKWK